jgi:Amidohydrolase family
MNMRHPLVVRRRSNRELALLVVLVLVFAGASAAQQASRYALVTSSGTIGTLTVTENGRSVDNDYRVDDNGRGSKLREHVELGPDGLPRRWEIQGTSWFGAPVKETFLVQNGRATWTSLDDKGEADAKSALYLANNGTPWAKGLYLKTLLAAKGFQRNVLPGGAIRAEELRSVQVGSPKDEVVAYAIWGLDVAPQFVLTRKDHLVAWLVPGTVLVEEKHQGDFAELSTLAGELSADALKSFTTKVTHSVPGPLWLTNVRVFDPVSGQVGAPTNVGIFRDVIVSVGANAPSDATIVDGGGGTLLPGLFDSHSHIDDWSGALNIAAGVTFVRDPGNDNDTLLLLEKRIAAGDFLGPRVKASGFLEGQSPFSAHTGFVVDTVDEAKARVQWYAAHGFWGVKIYNSMNPEFVRPIADEAHRLGLHVSGHVPAFMSSERAIRDGYDEINHINQLILSFIIDPLKDDTRTTFRFSAVGERLKDLDLQSEPVQKMVALMKERKTTLDPTLATFSPVLMGRPATAAPSDRAWIDHMPVAIQRARKSAVLDVKPDQYAAYDASWKKLEGVLQMLYQNGIPLVPGTDDTAGMMLHSELEAWVRAGIPASAALGMATLGGARFLGLDAQQGTIAPGKLADLYLVNGDPTADIGVIRKGRLVVKGGNVYYPDEIHEALGVKPFEMHAPLRAPAGK